MQAILTHPAHRGAPARAGALRGTSAIFSGSSALRSTALRPLARILAAIQVVAVTVLVGAILLLLVGVVPTFFGAETFTVLSGSMEPALSVGSLAVVQAVPTEKLQPGDIITYRTPAQPDALVTHRLMSAQRTPDGKLQFETKGDANNVADLVAVDPNAVLGKVVYSVPYIGFLGDFAKRPQGMLLFVGIPGLLLALDFFRERLRRRPADSQAPAVTVPAVTVPAVMAPVPASPAPASAVAAEPNGVSTPPRTQADTAQVAELVSLGQQAAAGGHRELAGQAADKAIQLDPRNQDAWILKADCAATHAERLSTLRTALLLNPGAERVAALLRAAEAQARP